MTKDRRYWDSDCFLGWFNGEPDKADRCNSVLDAANSGKIVIVTSALTLAEVLDLRGFPPMRADRRHRVERFFQSPFIAVRNITRRVAEDARELVWDRHIKPKDPLHIATAIDARIPLFNTFDEKLIRKCRNGAIPGLTVEPPQVAEPELPFPLEGPGW